MYKNNTHRAPFYGFNCLTGEIYAPISPEEREHYLRKFLRMMWIDFHVDRRLPFAWRFFRTEHAMQAYAHDFVRMC